MGAGVALQGRLGLHLPTAGVKGEDLIGAFPMIIPPTKDVDLPVTHSHATALLDGQTEKTISYGVQPEAPFIPVWPGQTTKP